MSEARAIMRDGEWVKVESCGKCSLRYDSNHTGKSYCSRVNGFNADIKIEDREKVHENCGLPKYDKIRWHEASESIEKKYTGYVEVRLQKLEENNIIIGFCSANYFKDNVIDSQNKKFKTLIGFVEKYRLIKWRYAGE